MNPYAIIGGILLLIAVAFGSYHKGDANGDARVQAKWNTSKLAQSEANNKVILAAVAANEAAHQTDIKQTQKVIANYETTIDIKNAAITAERNAAKRLRLDRAAVCLEPAATSQAASAKPINDTREAATIDLPKEVERRLLDSAEDADREVARLQAKVTGLQDWIRSNGFYGSDK